MVGRLEVLGVRRTGRLWFDDPDAPRLLTADSLGQGVGCLWSRSGSTQSLAASQVFAVGVDMDRACQCLVVWFDCRTRRRVLHGRSRLDSGASPSALVELGIGGFVTHSGTTYVVWVVDAKACLSCGTPDYVLRGWSVVNRHSYRYCTLETRPTGFGAFLSPGTPAADARGDMSVTGARRAFGARDIPFLVVCAPTLFDGSVSRGPQPRSREVLRVLLAWEVSVRTRRENTLLEPGIAVMVGCCSSNEHPKKEPAMLRTLAS